MTHSIAETKYLSMAATTVVLLHGIGLPLPQLPVLLCDNNSAMHMVKNLVIHA